jgi:hypothetical protein
VRKTLCQLKENLKIENEENSRAQKKAQIQTCRLRRQRRGLEKEKTEKFLPPGRH